MDIPKVMPKLSNDAEQEMVDDLLGGKPVTWGVHERKLTSDISW